MNSLFVPRSNAFLSGPLRKAEPLQKKKKITHRTDNHLGVPWGAQACLCVGWSWGAGWEDKGGTGNCAGQDAGSRRQHQTALEPLPLPKTHRQREQIEWLNINKTKPSQIIAFFHIVIHFNFTSLKTPLLRWLMLSPLIAAVLEWRSLFTLLNQEMI